MSQFYMFCILVVFALIFPWFAGGFVSSIGVRSRRVFNDVFHLFLGVVLLVAAQRAEAFSKSDWDIFLGVLSSCLASNVDMSSAMAIQRAMRRSGGAEFDDRNVRGGSCQN